MDRSAAQACLPSPRKKQSMNQEHKIIAAAAGPEDDARLRRAYVSSEWRIIPILSCLWLLAWVDRANISFAKLQMLTEFQHLSFGCNLFDGRRRSKWRIHPRSHERLAFRRRLALDVLGAGGADDRPRRVGALPSSGWASFRRLAVAGTAPPHPGGSRQRAHTGNRGARRALDLGKSHGMAAVHD